MSLPSISFIVPCYNEELNLKKTINSILLSLKKIAKINYQIIIIDDGSIDNTKQIYLESYKNNKQIKFYSNIKNYGLGYSIRRGIKLAQMEKLIFIPGDNELKEEIITELIKHCNQADLVITYFINDEIRGRNRLLISTIFNLIYQYSFNIFLKYINGPAIYNSKALKKLNLHSNKFSIIAEINIKLLRSGMSYIELPSYRQNSLNGSSPINVSSFIETINIYIRTLIDVYLLKRNLYKNSPKRNLKI